MGAAEFIQVCTTTASQDAARSLANRLVADRLAGCVQIEGPITSVYRWQGDVESASEWRLVIKTRGDLFEQVAAVISDEHDYDVPQITATEMASVAVPYAQWLADQLK